MLAYAVPDDVTTGPSPWVLNPPGNLDQLCRWATIEVSHACQLSLYGDAPTGVTAQVLKDATCAQVASWVALGVDPAKAGTDMPGPVKSSTILAATVARDTTAAAKRAVEAVNGLCDLASDILQTAGLLWVALPLGADKDDRLPEWGQGLRRWLFVDPLSGEPEFPFVGTGVDWYFQ